MAYAVTTRIAATLRHAVGTSLFLSHAAVVETACLPLSKTCQDGRALSYNPTGGKTHHATTRHIAVQLFEVSRGMS